MNFYASRYRKLIPPYEVSTPKIIPSNWYKYNSEEVDTGNKRSAINDLMKRWVDWEIETRNLLQKSYKELYDLGEIVSALFIADLLKNVDEELVFARKELNDLDTINYDISIIVPLQDALYKEYAE